jgi:hypothetical protein
MRADDTVVADATLAFLSRAERAQWPCPARAFVSFVGAVTSVSGHDPEVPPHIACRLHRAYGPGISTRPLHELASAAASRPPRPALLSPLPHLPTQTLHHRHELSLQRHLCRSRDRSHRGRRTGGHPVQLGERQRKQLLPVRRCLNTSFCIRGSAIAVSARARR